MAHQVSSTKPLQGIWQRICIWLHLTREEQARDGFVQVWDGQQCRYRMVDLSDRNDPLWATANALASHYGRRKRRPAA